MNRIILVGNGFDLAHGLPTSYKDFIHWYFDEWAFRLLKCTERIDKDILCTFELPLSYAWSSYLYRWGSSTNRIKGHELINNLIKDKRHCNAVFCQFMQNIYKSLETKRWVDIENEYYKLLKPLASNYLSDPDLISAEAKKLNDELDYLTSLLIEYLNQVQNRYLTKDNNINPEIENLIFEQININDISVETKSKLNEKTDDIDMIDDKYPNRIMILNFNYTKTADIQTCKNGVLEIKTNYIHGDLSNHKSIIFGYGDELDNNFRKILDLNDNNMLKEIKSVRYLEADNYRNLLEFIESDIFQIYVMGHSCGNSDRTLLNTLFEHKNCATIKPFYHKREDNSDDYLNIVQNIMRNFNDMKMMRDKVVDKTRCKPLPQMKLQPKQQTESNYYPH